MPFHSQSQIPNNSSLININELLKLNNKQQHMKMISTCPCPVAFLVCWLQTLPQRHYTHCSLKEHQMHIHQCQKFVSMAHLLKQQITNQDIKMVFLDIVKKLKNKYRLGILTLPKPEIHFCQSDIIHRYTCTCTYNWELLMWIRLF